MKLRIVLLAFIFILFPIILSGCWDYEEYEDLVQVSAIGIDYDKESHQTKVTLQYIPTTKSLKGGGGDSAGPSKNQEIVHSATTKSFYDALTKLQQVIFKKLFFGYLKVIVIGEDAAKYKMNEIIRLLDRTPDIRSTANIVITSEKAEDTISTIDANMVASSSEEINKLIDLSNNTGVAYSVSVFDFTAKLAIPGMEATAPRIITVSNEPKPEVKGGTEGNIRYDEERKGDHRLAGIAAFKNVNLVGWLDEKESLGYGWITGKNINSYKASENPDDGDTEKIFYYRVLKSSGKIKVKIEKGQPVFQVNVNVVADLRKNYSNNGNEFLSPKDVSFMEKKLSESIRSDIEVALEKGQKELKSDIFGFGFALFRKNPKLWRTEYEQKWDNIFPDLPINIKVDADIINTGTTNKKLFIK